MSIASPPPPAPLTGPEPTETPTPEPTPTPALIPTDTPDPTLGPSATAVTTAAQEEPALVADWTGAAQLVSTAPPEGLSNPYASGAGGWTAGVPPVDSYTALPATDNVLSPYVLGQSVETYTGVPPTDQNPNAFAGTDAAVNPFDSYRPSAGPTDTSQWIASNDAVPPGSQDTSGNGDVVYTFVQQWIENGVLMTRYQVWVGGNPVNFVTVPGTPTGGVGASPQPAPSPTPAPAPSPAPAPTPSTAAAPAPSLPAPVLPQLPAPDLPQLPAPPDPPQPAPSLPPPDPQPTQAAPALNAGPAGRVPSPSLAEQVAPSANSPSWQQYDWAVGQMMDETNPWYGRAAAGVGAAASAIWASAERFAFAPTALFLARSLEGVNMAIDEAANALGLDPGAVNLFLWEREAPAAAAEALSYLSLRAEVALSHARIPLFGIGAGGLGFTMVPRTGAALGNDTNALSAGHLADEAGAPWSPLLEGILGETEGQARIDRLLNRVNLPAPGDYTPSRLPEALEPPAGGDPTWYGFNTGANGTRTLDAVLDPSSLTRTPGPLPRAVGYEPGLGYDASHMGMRAMGFPNTLENSVTLAHEANAYGTGQSRPVSMLDFERQVVRALNDGQTVRYRVTAIFPGSATNPEAVVIQASGSGPNGIIIDTVIRNWSHHP